MNAVQTPLPRSWADWEFLGEDETDVVLVSVEDAPTREEAVEAALTACRNAGWDPTPYAVAEMTVKTKVLCSDEDHERGDCDKDSPCNREFDVWPVHLEFPEPQE